MPPELPEQIVTHPEEFAAVCEELARYPVFGFDTEFVGEDSYHPRLCLVQVATEDRLLLIDPLSVGPLDAFWRLVTDPAHVVVVHAGREEVRMCRLWTGQAPGNLFDLQLAAGLLGMQYPIGHGNLVQQVLGIPLSKGETLTEWRTRPLTPAQVRYAFDDVRFLLALYKRLDDRLEKLGRRSWAAEEFAALAATPVSAEETAEEKWRKLRGLGSLDRRRLATARALFAWREAEAARTNKPTRAILRDDLIVEIAKRGPSRDRDLHVVRGLPRRSIDGILETVAQARELPADQLPRPQERDQDPPQVTLASQVLSAVLGDLCTRLQLAPSLVASNTDVKLLVRAHRAGRPVPEESQLAHGWRREHILPELVALLEGRSLRIGDLRADSPFAFGD